MNTPCSLGINNPDSGRQDNSPDLLPWSALHEAVEDYEAGTSKGLIGRLTLAVAVELARKLGGFKAMFDLQTTAHLTGGTVIVPVQQGWEISQVLSPDSVTVENNRIMFNSIIQPSGATGAPPLQADDGLYNVQYPSAAQDGWGGVGRQNPYPASNRSECYHATSNSIMVHTLLKPVMTDSCVFGLPKRIYNEYNSALLHGVMAKLYMTAEHVDPQKRRVEAIEYQLAVKALRVERSKGGANKPVKLRTWGFI